MLKTDYKGAVDGLSKIWKQEGVKGMYRGLGAALLTNSFGYLFILSTYRDEIPLDAL